MRRSSASPLVHAARASVGLLAALATVASAQEGDHVERAALGGVTVAAVRTDKPGTFQEITVPRAPGFQPVEGGGAVKKLVLVDHRLELRLSAMIGQGATEAAQAAAGAVLVSLVNLSEKSMVVARTEPACCDTLKRWGMAVTLPKQLTPGEEVPVVALPLESLRRSSGLAFSAVLDTGQRYNWRIEVSTGEAAQMPRPTPTVVIAEPTSTPIPPPTRPALLPSPTAVALPMTPGFQQALPSPTARELGITGVAPTVPLTGAASAQTPRGASVPSPAPLVGVLARASRAYLVADFAAAVSLLDPVPSGDRRTQAVALLLRGAARFALYREGGEKDAALKAQGAADVRACYRLEPNLPADTGVFSPAIATLINQAR